MPHFVFVFLFLILNCISLQFLPHLHYSLMVEMSSGFGDIEGLENKILILNNFSFAFVFIFVFVFIYVFVSVSVFIFVFVFVSVFILIGWDRCYWRKVDIVGSARQCSCLQGA